MKKQIVSGPMVFLKSARGKFCLAMGLLIFCAEAGAVVFAQTAARVQAQDAVLLELGKSIPRDLAGGESHSYQIALTEGQYLNVVVEQRGIDVVVYVFGPDDKQIAFFDSEFRPQGLEIVSQVAETTGNYQLRIQPRLKDAPVGYYAIRVAELRPVTEKDRALQEARKLTDEFLKLQREAKYEQARPLIERALEIREKALGPEHPDVAGALNNLAEIHQAKSEFAKAESLFLRALAIRGKTQEPEHPAVASALNNLAEIYRAQNEFAKAEPLYLRALAILEKALGPDHQNVASCLNNIANLAFSKGDYAKAEPLWRRALAIWEKSVGPENPLVAYSLNNLAILYREKGINDKAEPLYQRTLAILEKALGPDHPDVAQALSNIANLDRDRGDYVKAEILQQRALAIREKAFGPEHPMVAYSLANAANVSADKGDYVKAESLYRRGLGILEKVFGPEHPDVAISLDNLAALYDDLGDYAKAGPLFKRALAIREKSLGLEHHFVAQSLNNLATIYRTESDFVKAESLHERALAIYEKSLGPEHPDNAYALNGFASTFRAKGDFAKAETMWRRALAVREKTLGPEHPLVAASLNSLARICAANDELNQAIALQSRSSAVRERNLALNLATGSEREKMAYLATLAAQTNEIISLHVGTASNDPKARDLAVTMILQRKGRVLDAMTDSFAMLRGRLNEQDQELLDQLQSALSQLARLVLDEPEQITAAEHRSRIKSLDEEVEKLQAEISGRSAEFRAQSAPITLAAIQAAIPVEAALVEFFVYRPHNAKFTKPEEEFGAPRYVAYILHQQGTPQWADLGEAKAIDEAIAAWRRAIRDPKRRDAPRLARAVDRLVMQPVRARLGATRRVLLSPDGALNLIPFAALVDERSRYLVEQYEFSYLSSGRDLLRLQVKQPGRQSALIVANPNYGEMASGESLKTKPGSKTFTTLSFDPLPATADEARALKKTLPMATILLGDQATEAAVKHARGPDLLHVATHGFFLPALAPPANTRRRGRGLDGEIAPGSAPTENPLLLSGLALAGANLRHNGDEDGVLTALEATALDLWGTKLVVLSACDTGVGEVKNGEGVYGLRRALVLAGSESQVMSLWPVSDEATLGLMAAYYQGLQQGQGRGTALRQVQLRMLRSRNRRHPFYWAGFIQSGEWANLQGRR